MWLGSFKSSSLVFVGELRTMVGFAVEMKLSSFGNGGKLVVEVSQMVAEEMNVIRVEEVKVSSFHPGVPPFVLWNPKLS